MTKRFPWLTKRGLLISIAAGVIVFVVLLVYQPSWTGFGVDSTKNTERDSTGKIVKTIEIEESSKTLWDWLGLLGVPVGLATLGYLLQQQEQRRVSEQAGLEQRRASEQAALEKEIAEGDRREEALQIYFDRLSELLVDKNLIAIATELENIRTKADPFATEQEDERLQKYVDQHQQKLDAAVDVVRARTLSILRRLKDDGERKGSVIEFLIETEVISKLELDLRGADLHAASLFGTKLNAAKLSGADLRSADLRSADLRSADLSGADLSGADLRSADLRSADLNSTKLKGANFENFVWFNSLGADLRGINFNSADLSSANFNSANLSSVNFDSANLMDANLTDADLSNALNLGEIQLSLAKLCNTKLPKGIKLSPDRDCKELEVEF